MIVASAGGDTAENAQENQSSYFRLVKQAGSGKFVAGEELLKKRHFVEPELREQSAERRSGPFIGVFDNAVFVGSAAEFLEGILACVLFEVFVEGSHQPCCAFEDLRPMIIEVNIG